MTAPRKAKTVICACGEVILRGFVTGGRWRHTDGRQHCIDALTREPTGSSAAPRVEPTRLDEAILARNLRRAGVRR